MIDSKRITELLEELMKEGKGRITIIIRGEDTKTSRILTGECFNEAYKLDIKYIISNMLIEMGVKTNCKGYKFLKEAIQICFKNMECLEHIAKKLYPQIASKYREKPSNVERAIRYQIETVWKNNNNSKLKEVFGNTKYFTTTRPTNSQFISTVVRKLQMQFNED